MRRLALTWLGSVPVANTPLGTTAPSLTRAPVTRVHDGLEAVDRVSWDALYAGSPEGWDLYRSFEATPSPGFRLGAMTVEDGAQLIGGAPLFEMVYRLDTPFQGRAKALGDRLHALAPRLTSVSVLGLGSPLSDNCCLGVAAHLDAGRKAGVVETMIDGLMREAKVRRSLVVAVKSLGSEAEHYHEPLTAAGFGRVTSVPVVMLPLSFISMDAYYASLPKKTASYLKRKMKGADGLRIEYRGTTDGLEGQLMHLYKSTLAQSAVSYGEIDEIHPRYFTEMLSRLGDRARLMLCWKGEELLSFQVFLIGRDRVIANKIGMRYPQAREHNLYFVNWLAMIECAIAERVPLIEMGATTYAAKLMFGGHIERRWLYFRFVNGLVNRFSRPLHPLFDFERNDPELKALATSGGLRL